MKSLIAGIVLIILIGIGGFIYRNVQERTGGPTAVACTEEAKVCPDGTSVGRGGPACEFAPCAFPNVEIPLSGLVFVAPAGYIAGDLGEDKEPTTLAGLSKATAPNEAPHYINVFEYLIPEGKTAEDVMMSRTTFSPSDEKADSMDKFKPVLINGRTFQSVVIERFEGLVHSAYYFDRGASVLKFEVYERNVMNWTDPNLVIGNLPEHKALLQMLSTLTLN